MWQELEATSQYLQLSSGREQKATVHTHCSASFLLYVQDPDPGNGAAYLQAGLSVSFNIIKIAYTTHVHTRRHANPI